MTMKLKMLPRSSIRGKVSVRFPGTVSGISPVEVDQSGGNYSIGIDINALDDLLAGVGTFLELSDTPDSYSGQGGNFVAVNVAENALEFIGVIPGAGDVVGPASSTDNAIVRFDGLTGKIIQNSGVIVDDSNNVSGIAALSSTTIELGHASDTTLSRSSAGVLAVEGVNVLTTATGQPLDGTLTALAAYNTNGLLTQTAFNTFAGRTITGTTNQITVTAGNGVADNPTLSLPADVIIPTVLTVPNTGLHLLDTNASHDLIIKPGSDITADRTFTITTGNTDMIVDFTAVTDEFVLAYDTGSNTWRGVTPPVAGTPTLITVANEATDTTCFPAFFTAATGDLGPKTNANMTFNSSTGVVTFASSVLTTADINGGTIDATVIGGATPAAGTFTAAIANSFVPNSSTVPSNGMYLPAANTLGWAISSAAELQLTGTALSPAADGGSSLGTTALGWQNLFGNTGFVLNIEGGNWVATHTSAVLTVGTGDLRVTTAGTNTASVVTVGGTQILTGKTLTSPILTTPEINDTSSDHQYIFAVSELTADRTVTLPLLTGNDTFVFAAFTQTLTNKTVDLTSNTLVGSVAEFNAALESADFYTTGGTDVALADGGTGASLSDPGVDRLLGWDEAGNAVKFMASADFATEASPTSGVDFLVVYRSDTDDVVKVDWASLPGAGGGTSAFGTIQVSGQSDVVADAAPDVLTLVAGTNITITTNASTDTITINSSGGGGTPGGADTQVQYNDGGAFGGDAGLLYNETTDTLTVLGNIELGNATDTTLSRSAAGTVQIEGVTIATASNTLTLTNKTIDLASNTLTGTTAQFNTALSDGDFATLAGAETLSNKVLDLPQINDTSDDHQYVFAVSELAADRTVTLPLLTGNDTFVFAAFVQTLTNKTINLANNTVTGTMAEFNAAISDGDIQPLDADLTSWAAITRAAGFDTFVATPSSANLAALVTGETGTGALVFGTSPTLSGPVLDLPQINDTSGDHQYVFAVSELVADRTVTLPLLTGNDTFVFEAHTQTLTNKSLTSPTITGTATASGATWTSLGTVTTIDINGGTVDGAVIGGASAAAITGTNITANTNFLPDANDGAGLGVSGTAFSDLFLASGAVIDFAAANVVLTHSTGILNVTTGDLQVTTAGTNAQSVVTVGGTQTLTSKTLTSPTITTSPTAAGATWADLGTVTIGTFANTGLHIFDTDATHDLILKPGSNLTADRTLTITTGDTDMIVNFTAVTDEFVLAYDTGTNTWRGVTPSGGSGTPGGSDTQVQYNNAGAFGGMAGTSWDDTNRSLTITGATVTANNPVLELSQTWNDAGVTFQGILLNITTTASAAASTLLNIQQGGLPRFVVSKSGGATTVFGATGGQPRIQVSVDGDTFARINFGLDTSDAPHFAMGAGGASSRDAFLYRDAAQTLAQRNGTSAQVFRVYRTFTDSSNHERLALQTGSGYVELAAETAGTGTDNLDVRITPAGTGDVVFPASSDLKFGAVSIISDSAGTTTLSNIDAIDPTTESTIETAIDTLANLTSIQGFTVTLSDAGFDVLAGWDDSAAAYKNFLLADIATEGAPAAGDFVLIYGAEGDFRKVNWSGLPGAGGGISNIVEDTTPELGGPLETNNNPIWLEQYSADSNAQDIAFLKSRNASIGAHTVVQNGDDLGWISFQGSDGDQFHPAAAIQGFVDGTPGNNDMPGRLVFLTTPNGSVTPTERMRITRDGAVRIGSGTFIDLLQTQKLQVVAGDEYTAVYAAFRADEFGVAVANVKSRNATPGSFTIVQSGDSLGDWVWHGDDGVDYVSRAASIACYVDGTPGVGDMPGRLVFSTTAGGAETSTERLRISADGSKLSTGRNMEAEVNLTDGAPVALNVALGNTFKLVATADRTISVPTNKPASGQVQKIVIMHEASGANRTLTLTTGSAGAFRFGTDITALTATTSGLVDYIGCIYHDADDRWDVVSYVKGY